VSSLALYVLGPPRVELDGEPVAIDRRKALALLVYLAITRQDHSRDALATLFWPEYDQSRARGGLRSALWSLTKALGEGWLEVDRESVRLKPEADAWLDVDAFQDRLEECRTHDHPPDQPCPACLSPLAEAAALYRDDFLAGFTLPDSPGFDEWQFFQTQSLRQELARSLERLVHGHTIQGAYLSAIPYARRWLALDPLHEPAHQQLMQLYAWSGQRAAAFRQYAECERVLGEELDVPPDEGTTQLYQSIKDKQHPPPPGDRFATLLISQKAALHDRYRLEAELGRGGMSVVYRGHDTLLDRDVAVKVLRDTGLGEKARARLLREACAAATLNHPNIVSVFDAGESDGSPFIVMELVEGESLYDLKAAGDRRLESLDEILAIARQICAALEHAHARDIVHRDLKPENVLLARDSLPGTGGTAKLVDFGLARSVASRLTGEGTIAGTAFYLAPELALGQAFDGRADLYALGVMLYELTTGRLPFSGDDSLAVISQHLHTPVVPPRAKNPQIPSALNDLVLRLLSKRPQERPASAAEVLQILDAPGFLDTEEVPVEELSVIDRIERGRLVGREGELQAVRALWRGALAGQGQLLLVSGEPGVGKSRLVQELVTQVQVAGDRALVGACYAEGGGPYAPFAQILRRAFRDGAGDGLNGLTHLPSKLYGAGELAKVLPAFVLADLLTLAPTLRLRFPDIPPNPPLDPQSEQQRLFESMVACCAALSEGAPLLLVLEDVHWADSGTLSLLRHLARRARRQRMLLVATYREAELDEARPFRQVLLDLHRERLAERLKLSRLDREGTKELLAVLFDEEITPEFLDGIYRETEGNPFFIEEVCKALVESGEVYFADGRWDRPSMEELEIPQSVRVAIQSRVGKLPPQVQETLRLAAVLGREFDFDTLRKVGDQGEDTLFDALERAERAQLIGEVSAEGGGTFAFTHALIPTTLVEGLSGLRRRLLHRQVMTGIERLHRDDFESLSFHALEAGDLQKGLDFSLRAGEKAQRVYACEDALFHYGRAREIAASLDLPEQLSSIHEAMGDIQDWSDISQAIGSFERALNLTTDPERRAGIKSKIGTTYARVGDERGREFLEAAINELNPDTQGNELALATCYIGRFHHFRGQHRQALTHLERARQIAEPLDEPHTLTHIYVYLAGAHLLLAEFDKSMEWARQAIALGEQKTYPLAIMFGYEYLAEVSVGMGKWQDALEFAGQERQIGERIGLLGLVAWAENNFATAYYGLGDLLAAEKAGRKSLEMAEAVGDFRLAVLAGAQLSIIQTDLGQAEIAEENAKTAVQRGIDRNLVQMVHPSLGALAHCHMQYGDWENAIKHLDQFARVIAESDNRYDSLLNGPQYAEASLRTGQLDKAVEIVERTLTQSREAPSRHIEAVARRVQAQILAAQGAWDEAARCFDEAIARLEQLGSRLELGRALYHRGTMQADRGEAQDARTSLARALEIFQASSAKIDAEGACSALDSLEIAA
jgi:DNA-binding SARP family transcriptional activator